MQNKRLRAEKMNFLSLAHAVVFLCAGCGRDVVGVDKVEVYYRDFSILSPYSYSSAELERVAPVKKLVTDPEDINELIFFSRNAMQKSVWIQ